MTKLCVWREFDSGRALWQSLSWIESVPGGLRLVKRSADLRNLSSNMSRQAMGRAWLGDVRTSRGFRIGSFARLYRSRALVRAKGRKTVQIARQR